VGSTSLDLVGFETCFDAPPQLSSYIELASWPHLGNEKIVNFHAPHPLNPGNLGFGHQVVFECRIIFDFPGNVLQQLNHAITVLLVVDSDVQRDLRPVAGHVADNGDTAVGNHVQRAVGIAQQRTSHADFFDLAGHTGSTDHVADLVLVFDQDEKPVNHVLDQRLGAEPNSQAGNAGAGQKGRDVDIEDILEDRHAGKEQDEENADAADHFDQRAYLLRSRRPWR